MPVMRRNGLINRVFVIGRAGLAICYDKAFHLRGPFPIDLRPLRRFTQELHIAG